MAYDESVNQRGDTPRPESFGGWGSGFDEATVHRDDPTATGYRAAPLSVGDFREADAGGRAGDDEPAWVVPGRDRMAVHLGWELVLLVGAVALAVLLFQADPTAFRGSALNTLLVTGTVIGLLTLAGGSALRASVPNLAIGSVSVASALHFAENSDQGALAAAFPAIVAAAALGLGLALFVVVFRVPAWAASLAAALAVMVFIQLRPGPVKVQGQFDPSEQAVYLFGGFVAVALLGGLFGTIPTVRRVVGVARRAADPAARPGGGAGFMTAVMLVLSMVYATLAGVLLAAGSPDTVRPSPGIEWTALALGTAMVAGTSAFGRRGGVFGTTFAVMVLTLLLTYVKARRWDVPIEAVAAGALVVGLVVTRLVEWLGRPRSHDIGAGDGTFGSRWDWDRGDRDSWTAPLPAQPTDGRDDPWARWGRR